MIFKNIGIGLSNRTSASELVRAARAAEDEGFSSVWINETGYYRGAFSCAMAIAGATARAKIGIGVVSPLIRHPMAIAMEAATLDEFSKGRLTLGLGLSHNMARPLGVYPSPSNDRASSLSSIMRESFDIIRRIMRGDEVEYYGESFKVGGKDNPANLRVGLGFKPIRDSIQLYMGAMSPKMLQLAGEIADGVLLTMMAPPKYLNYVRVQIQQGKSERTKRDVEIVPHILISVADDSDDARDAVRELVGLYLLKLPLTVLRMGKLTSDEIAGASTEFRRLKGRVSSPRGLRGVITDDLVESFTVAGSPAECSKRLKEYRREGATEVILVPPPNQNQVESIRRIGAEVARVGITKE